MALLLRQTRGGVFIFTQVDGLNVYYSDSGSGAPVLFLHGWGSSGDAFAGIIRLLSKKPYRLIAIDFPGCGKSDYPQRPLTLEDYASIVLGVMEHLSVKDPILFGHSHGGRVALYLAGMGLVHPPKMVLFGAAGMKAKSNLKKRLKTYGFKTAKWFLTLPGLRAHTAETLNRLRAHFGSADYNAAPEVLRKTLVHLINRDIRELFPAIAASTLLIWGENDTATPLYMAQYMEKAIPDCGLCVIKNAGHWCFAENPAAVYPIIESFLN